jgi:hypothetical protein
MIRCSADDEQDPQRWPDRLGVWWLAPPQKDRQIRQILKARMNDPVLLGTPLPPPRWAMGFRGLWQPGMGAPEPEQAFKGRQWALSPEHPWVQRENVALKVACRLHQAFGVEGTLLLVASWRNEGLQDSPDALLLNVSGVLGDPLLLSTFQLPPRQSWAVVQGVQLAHKNNRHLDVVSVSMETLVGQFLRQQWGAGKPEAWHLARRLWQLEQGLPIACPEVPVRRF